MSNPRFNWLHLTDLHFGLSGQKELWPNVKAAFFDDLAKLSEKCGPWDVVLFTGDFVQKGSRDEYQRLDNEVLGPLWEKLAELDSGNAILLAVPGNHDLVRPAIDREPTAAEEFMLDPSIFSKVATKFWSDPTGEYRAVVDTAFSTSSDGGTTVRSCRESRSTTASCQVTSRPPWTSTAGSKSGCWD